MVQKKKTKEKNLNPLSKQSTKPLKHEEASCSKIFEYKKLVAKENNAPKKPLFDSLKNFGIFNAKKSSPVKPGFNNDRFRNETFLLKHPNDSSKRDSSKSIKARSSHHFLNRVYSIPNTSIQKYSHFQNKTNFSNLYCNSETNDLINPQLIAMAEKFKLQLKTHIQEDFVIYNKNFDPLINK